MIAPATAQAQGPQDGRYGYIDNFQDDVKVLDLYTNTVVDTIHIDPGPASLNPTGQPGSSGDAYVPLVKKVYVSNQYAGTVTVIDTRTNQVIKTLQFPGSAPNATTLAPDGIHLWVAIGTWRGQQDHTLGDTNYGFCAETATQCYGAVAVINTLTDRVEHVISNHENKSFPADVQFQNGLAYTANYQSNTLSVFSMTTFRFVRTIHLPGNPGLPLFYGPGHDGAAPSSVAPFPDGKTIYATQEGISQIVKINVWTGAQTVYPVNAFPAQLLLSQDHTFFFVPELSNTIQKFSTSTNTITQTAPATGGPISSNEVGPLNRYYTVNVDDGTVSVYDLHTLAPITTFSVGRVDSEPIEMAINSSEPIEP